jgi:biotin carboxylase
MKTVAFIESNASGHGLNALAVAKSLGYRVIFVCEDVGFYRKFVTGNGPDPLAQVDEIVTARNTYSAASIHEAVGTRPIDGVVAFGDYHLIPAAEYAGMLGLPHCGIDALKRGRRKDLMRIWLRDHGVPMPRVAVVDDPAVGTSPVGYPCIVKPVDDSGSVGIHRADDDASFREAVGRVLDMKVNKRGFRLAGKALVEQFLEGTEMSAEAIWTEQGWVILGLSGRRNAGPIGASEVSLTFPADVDEDLAATIYQTVHTWLRTSGLNHGGAHVEFRVGRDGPQLLEINPRLAGARLTELIKVASGFDPVAYVIAQAVGDRISVPTCPLAPGQAATIEFLVSYQDGTLRAIDGLESVVRMPHVKAAEITARTPMKVAPVLTNYDFLGYVLAVGATPRDSMRHAREAIGGFTLNIA